MGRVGRGLRGSSTEGRAGAGTMQWGTAHGRDTRQPTRAAKPTRRGLFPASPGTMKAVSGSEKRCRRRAVRPQAQAARPDTVY